jgi:ABC-type multidrug transport system fused ATPase/permease subunit
MDNGKIVEVGSHEMLSLKKGAYYKLIENQLFVQDLN